jgi:hypothetical protein
MEVTETPAANTQTATGSVEAPTTATATAATETGTQTQTAETQTPPATEAAATTTATSETKPAATTSVVPERYEFKAPEGTEFDSKVIEAYSGAAKQAGLSQDTAQKLLESMAPALAARQAEQIDAIHTGWTEASTADKEFGGEKFKENLAVARKGLEAFSTPELRTLLDDTGLGSHPEVIRYFYRAGKAISEDKVVVGNPGGTPAKPVASILYDKTKNK